MVATFLRVLSSGVPLLLAATTTTTTLAHAADGPGYTSDELTVACGAEITACLEDETCTSCSSVPESSRADFRRCSEAAIAEAPDSSTLYCLSNVVDICCLDDASQNECLQNDQFMNYWMCELDGSGCWVDEITCGNDWVEEIISSSRSSISSGAARLADGSNVSA